MDVGAALANQDVASQYKLTIRTLGAKALAFAVAAVAGGAHTFFMSEQLKIKFQHGVSSVLTSPQGDVNILWIGRGNVAYSLFKGAQDNLRVVRHLIFRNHSLHQPVPYGQLRLDPRHAFQCVYAGGR